MSMPTGYTYVLGEKEVSFEHFALLCARNFGALVAMRDDDFSAEIPEALPRDTYHETMLAEALTELRDALDLGADECHRRARIDHEEACARFSEREARRNLLRERYAAMLDKVLLWKAPTPDHIGLAEFMAQQLRVSIQSDCHSDWDKPPSPKSGDEWKRERVAQLSRDVAYHAEHAAKEAERNAERQAWLDALRASLKEAQP
jgi:hypothetical protein